MFLGMIVGFKGYALSDWETWAILVLALALDILIFDVNLKGKKKNETKDPN